ncbi:hypothetical protein H0H92_004095 [Tricholoma furcatifolium]|nr:hypothetical protein H0H92_004095 [Tricholoma furcatifolium]
MSSNSDDSYDAHDRNLPENPIDSEDEADDITIRNFPLDSPALYQKRDPCISESHPLSGALTHSSSSASSQYFIWQGLPAAPIVLAALTKERNALMKERAELLSQIAALRCVQPPSSAGRDTTDSDSDSDSEYVSE